MTTKISSDNIQAATLATIGSGPKITQVLVCDSSYSTLDDTAVDIAGGYIKIIGSGFKTGATVTVNRQQAVSVTFISATELRAQVPAEAAGTYVVYVVNTDGGVALRVNGVTFSGLPTWTTGSTLPNGDSGTAISIQLQAVGAVSYALAANSNLPSGLTLTSGGLLSGVVEIQDETLYNFIVVATDLELQDSPRTFSISITTGDPLFAQTTLLLSGSANTFVRDASANNFAVTVAGDTRPNTFNPYLTGWSNYFDGTGDELYLPSSSAFNLGAENFTIEMWVNFNFTNIQGQYFFYCTGFNPNMFLWNNGVIYLRTAETSGEIVTPTASGIVAGQWTHVACVRSGNDYSIYINGVLKVSGTSTGVTSVDKQIFFGKNVNGYISNFRLVKGTALYTENFTPSTTPLEAIAGTSLLTCQSNRFIDNSTNNFAITRNGDVKVQSFSPFVEPATTSGSSYFDGSGDYLSAPVSAAYNFTGDFTIEAWVYPTVINANNTIAAKWSGGLSFLFKIVSGSRLYIACYPGSTVVVQGTSTTVNLNQWNHVAVTRSGTTVKLFVNGVQDTTTGTVSGSLTSGAPLTIGSDATNEYFTGYISNLRIVKGTALYTANFTPPAEPLTAVAGTSLLTLQNNQPANNSQFLDSGSNNLLVTRAGNATQGTFSPYSPSGWSNYFDGTGDYLTPAAAAAFTMATQDFTYECWVYLLGTSPVGAANALTIFDNRTAEPSITPSLFVSGSGNGSLLTYYVNGVAVIEASSAFPFNTWTHVALARNGGTTKLYQNGLQIGNAYSDTNNYAGTTTVIGGRFASVSGDFRSWFGYISNLRIVKGTAVYTANFTPPTQPLTVIPGTSLLTCADNRFIDNSPNRLAITRNGDVRVQNFAPFKAVTQTPVSYSTYFDGTGDYLSSITSTSTAFGTGDYTIESWIYRSDTGVQRAIVDTRGADATGILFYITDEKLKLFDSSTVFLTGASNVPASQWVHVAVTRSSGTTRLFINGIIDATLANDTRNNSTGAGGCFIGRQFGSTVNDFLGYISNVRVVKGTAVYTANFTPSTTPLAAIANTSLLTCQSATFVDNSTNRFAITAVGNSQPTTVNPFGSTSANSAGYSAAEYSGSMYFDGTGDFLTIPGNRAFDLSAGHWTVECWFYQTSSKQVQLFSVGSARWRLDINTSQQVSWVFNTSSVVTSTNTAPLNQWNHVAVCFNGTFFMYLNGVSQSVIPNGLVPATDTSSVFYVGRNVDASGAWDFNGYISDIRTVKGQAVYTSSFVPPAAPVQPVPGTTLLLNGTSAAITDATTKNDLETVGDAKISTAVSKFGGSSLSFDGSGDSLSFINRTNRAIYFGSGNWTVEMWVYHNTTGNYDHRLVGGTEFYDVVFGVFNFGAQLGFWNNNTFYGMYPSSNLTAGVWRHIVYVRNGNIITLYINGNSVATQAFSGTMKEDGANDFLITVVGSGLNGYMQDVRVTKGIARYTANFTPPTVAFNRK